MADEVIACPRCGKHINFSIIELTADKEVAFVQTEPIERDGEFTARETTCPEGHSFWYAVTETDPLSA